MAGAKKNRETSVKKQKWYETYKTMKTKSGWTIEYNKDSNRLNLKREGVIMYSDVSSRACQNIAADRHGVDYTEWTT